MDALSLIQATVEPIDKSRLRAVEMVCNRLHLRVDERAFLTGTIDACSQAHVGSIPVLCVVWWEADINKHDSYGAHHNTVSLFGMPMRVPGNTANEIKLAVTQARAALAEAVNMDSRAGAKYLAETCKLDYPINMIAENLAAYTKQYRATNVTATVEPTNWQDTAERIGRQYGLRVLLSWPEHAGYPEGLQLTGHMVLRTPEVPRGKTLDVLVELGPEKLRVHLNDNPLFLHKGHNAPTLLPKVLAAIKSLRTSRTPDIIKALEDSVK